MTRTLAQIAADIESKSPAERFQIVAGLLLSENRPDLHKLAWLIAEKTVAEHGAAEALARLPQPPSAERGLQRMRRHLSGGSS